MATAGPSTRAACSLRMAHREVGYEGGLGGGGEVGGVQEG